MSENFSDPQVLQQEMLVKIQHPKAGKQLFKEAEESLASLTRWLEKAKTSELTQKPHKG